MALPRCYYFPPLRPSQGRLGSRYGVRPGRTSGQPTFHAGLDLSIKGAPVGKIPAFSICDAYVERLPVNSDRRGPFSGYGNAVVLRCAGRDEGYWILYAHLHAHASYLRQFLESEVILPAGSPVGTVGRTTNAKFQGMHQHLHLEIRQARADGSSPFPGPYGPVQIPAGARGAVNIRRGYNIDPQAWLADRGITFGYRGAIQISKPGACLPSVASGKKAVAQALGVL